VDFWVVVHEMCQRELLAVEALLRACPAEQDVAGWDSGAAVKVMALEPAEGAQRKGRSLVLTASGERLAAFALDARLRVDDFLDKNAMSPPWGCAGPLMITRPMSMPRRGSRRQGSLFM